MPRSAILWASLANAIRFLAVDAVEKANSGHPGMPCGMADVATVLFRHHLKFSAANPQWPERDRFVLSCGHGSMLLYALLYLTGYEDITIDDIKNFRQINSPCAGHPEYGALAGIETTTGPLGQGLANAVGMALSEKRQNALDPTFSHYTYVFASDGDMMEGISHEALSFAGHYGLNKLIIFYDANNITIDGALNLSCSDDASLRFQSYGFYVQSIDGHDYNAIDDAITAARASDKPSIIICHTTIAKGAPHLAGSEKAHGSPLGTTEVAQMRYVLNWPYTPFEIPEDLLKAWRDIGKKTVIPAQAGTQENNAPPPWVPAFAGMTIPDTLLATRNASQLYLEQLIPNRPDIMIGSADLTPSNNTQTTNVGQFSKDNPAGQYIHFGIREHAMAGIMNGIALHGFFRPIGGTFLCFSDYMRPSIRLACFMKLPIIYVFTHDSIGLGEDGPTHQPVEHLSSLSAIPGIRVYRPCDTLETFACWDLALNDSEHPSLLCLSRQKLPSYPPRDLSGVAQGAYELANFGDAYTFVASGSEVQIAYDLAQQLKGKVISVPCLELWQNPEALLGTAPRIIIEAGCQMRWNHIIRPQDRFFGVPTFGHSAPYEDIYNAFGLTAGQISTAMNT